MSIRILTDSACDISQEEAKQLDICIIPMTTTFGDKEYLDGIDIDNRQFFEKLIESDELPRTSLINPSQYMEYFEKLTATGEPVLCITLAAKLSGCCQAAQVAAQDYEGQVTVLDSNNVCVGEQLLVRYAVSLRDQGLSVSEIVEKLEAKKDSIRLIALLDTLEYLKKGGRVSAAAAAVGNLLSIKPVIAIEDGQVAVLGKARGSRNGNNLLIELVKKSGGIDFSLPFTLAYSGLSDDLLQKYIVDSQPLYAEYDGELPICLIGSTIGTHAGPGAIALSFFAKEG